MTNTNRRYKDLIRALENIHLSIQSTDDKHHHYDRLTKRRKELIDAITKFEYEHPEVLI